MAAAATFSHGTQDLYPTFLRVQHGFSVHEVSAIAIVYNIGAILGCLCGGTVIPVAGSTPRDGTGGRCWRLR